MNTREMRENYELKCKRKNHYFHGCFAFVQLHCTPSLICPTVMPEKATSRMWSRFFSCPFSRLSFDIVLVTFLFTRLFFYVKKDALS